MVVGRGLIATRFRNFTDDSVLVFASGVSNSKLLDSEEYQREIELLSSHIEESPDKLFIYFSTYSVDDPDLIKTNYVQHKIQIEELIKKKMKRFLIVRTSNVVGNHPNPYTVTNFFFNKITNGEKFDCWKGAVRNLLDIDHLYEMTLQLLKEGVQNETVYLVNPVCYPALDIVREMEETLKLKADYSVIDKGVHFKVNTTESERLFKKLGLDINNYLKNLLKKYYLHAPGKNPDHSRTTSFQRS